MALDEYLDIWDCSVEDLENLSERIDSNVNSSTPISDNVSIPVAAIFAASNGGVDNGSL